MVDPALSIVKTHTMLPFVTATQVDPGNDREGNSVATFGCLNLFFCDTLMGDFIFVSFISP